jgi:hypothetical protein
MDRGRDRVVSTQLVTVHNRALQRRVAAALAKDLHGAVHVR